MVNYLGKNIDVCKIVIGIDKIFFFKKYSFLPENRNIKTGNIIM